STYVEKVLTLELKLSLPAKPDGGAATIDGATMDGGDASVADGGAASSTDGGAGASPTTLVITARDGTTPVVTDLWLYTLDGTTQTPLTAFTSTGARKTPRLMLPATIGGQPSGLVPADDGRQNGLMTNTTRGKLVQGAFVSTVDGTVTVTLPSPPTTPILVVAGVEDQRYTGAAVVAPDGSPGAVPDGTVILETHTRRSFERDVKPMLFLRCAECHNDQGDLDADLYLVAGTRDQLVNDNFALKEQTEDCADATPNDPAAQARCVQAVTKAQFLVEPGAPALSDLLQRARPDESSGTSTAGAPWYGSKGARYNPTYGDRRMPSTADTPDMTMWTNPPTYFDAHPGDFQILYDWVAQGAPP
ncbi:MAG TPA: hypothetical protein VK989_15660, partial [Polyangia bacterium]|nr:hypothetical protein [Polyangia bacterium]